MMEDKLVVEIFKRTLVLGLINLIVFFLIFRDMSYIYGHIFGLLISMINFLLLKNSIEKSVRMSAGEARRYATGQYFVRMMIYGLVMVIGALADYLSFFAVFLGLIMVKIVIVLSTIFDKNFLKR